MAEPAFCVSVPLVMGRGEAAWGASFLMPLRGGTEAEAESDGDPAGCDVRRCPLMLDSTCRC